MAATMKRVPTVKARNAEVGVRLIWNHRTGAKFDADYRTARAGTQLAKRAPLKGACLQRVQLPPAKLVRSTRWQSTRLFLGKRKARFPWGFPCVEPGSASSFAGGLSREGPFSTVGPKIAR
jgi:hypothetical protein